MRTLSCLGCALILASILARPVFPTVLETDEELIESLSKSPEKPDVTAAAWDMADGVGEEEVVITEFSFPVKDAPKAGG